MAAALGVLAGVEHLDHVGVLEPRRRQRLAAEAGHEGLVVGQVLGQQLDRHRALEHGVGGQEDGRHAARAQPALHAVAARDLGGNGHPSSSGTTAPPRRRRRRGALFASGAALAALGCSPVPPSPPSGTVGVSGVVSVSVGGLGGWSRSSRWASSPARLRLRLHRGGLGLHRVRLGHLALLLARARTAGRSSAPGRRAPRRPRPRAGRPGSAAPRSCRGRRPPGCRRRLPRRRSRAGPRSSRAALERRRRRPPGSLAPSSSAPQPATARQARAAIRQMVCLRDRSLPAVQPLGQDRRQPGCLDRVSRLVDRVLVSAPGGRPRSRV